MEEERVDLTPVLSEMLRLSYRIARAEVPPNASDSVRQFYDDADALAQHLLQMDRHLQNGEALPIQWQNDGTMPGTPC